MAFVSQVLANSLQSAKIARDNQSLQAGAKNQTHAQIDKLSEDFESIFLGIVLKSMRNTIPKDGLVHGGSAEQIYRSLLDAEYAKQLATQGKTGLAEAIAASLIRTSQIQNGKKSDSGGVGFQAYRRAQESVSIKPEQVGNNGDLRKAK